MMCMLESPSIQLVAAQPGRLENPAALPSVGKTEEARL